MEVTFFYLQRYELQNENSRIVFYFNSIDSTDTCAEVQAIRQTFVTDLKEVPVIVYDYYNQSKF